MYEKQHFQRQKRTNEGSHNLKAQQPEYMYFMLLFPYPTSTSYTIPFTGWEVNKLYSLVTKPLNLLELLSTPKCDAPLVKGSQVGTFWGPTHVGFCPALQLKKKLNLKCIQKGLASFRITEVGWLNVWLVASHFTNPLIQWRSQN